MVKHERGLYETLITEALDARLRGLGEDLAARRRRLRSAEAADRVALHLSRVIRRAIASVDEDERVAVSIALARNLIAETDAAIENSGSIREQPLEAAEVFHAVSNRLPDGRPETIPEPLIRNHEGEESSTKSYGRKKASGIETISLQEDLVDKALKHRPLPDKARSSIAKLEQLVPP